MYVPSRVSKEALWKGPVSKASFKSEILSGKNVNRGVRVILRFGKEPMLFLFLKVRRKEKVFA